MSIQIHVSVGELLDKLAILEIKAERLIDPRQVANVERELELMRAVWRDTPYAQQALDAERTALRAVNERLWDIENRIREKEHSKTFDADFIALARAVYLCNDERTAIKRRLNTTTESDLIEEKSYTKYDVAP